MGGDLETDVLKAVSRSFYLSLRLLPSPMRRPAGIAYLLARISDTIADSASASTDERLVFLDDFCRQVRGDASTKPFPELFLEGIGDSSERSLLRKSPEVLNALGSLSEGEIVLVREVLGTIIGGQRLDLERFRDANSKNIVVLPDEAALDDYTWRVAGCVGLFWTKLGFFTLGKSYSDHPQDELEAAGVEYGKGLQLVNILRDLPEDLKAGRSYLPVGNPTDEAELLAEFAGRREQALGKIACGLDYSRKLGSRRLRIASSLPALIGEETLEMMRGASLADLEARIKVPRRRIYPMVFQAWFGS